MQTKTDRLSLTALLFSLLFSGLCPAQDGADNRYAIIKDKVDYQVDSKRVGMAREGTVVKVDTVSGDWLWVGSKQAYLAKQDAVPFAEAVANYSKKIETQKTPANYFLRAKLYRSAGEYDKGIADTNAALAVKPGDLELLIYRGMLQIDARDFDAAIASFNQAFAQIEATKKESVLADFHLSKDAALMVNSRVIVLNNRGWASSEKQQYDAAIADFNRAALLDPSYARVILNRAITWERKGENDKAITDYNEVIRLVPDFAKAYNNRGRIRFAKGEFDKAIADYSEAIRLDSTFSLAYSNRRIAWESKGDWESLSRELIGQLKSKSPTVDAINAMAWLQATCPDEKYRNGKQAVELAKRACELTQWKTPGMLDTLAACFAEAGDFDQAISTQTKAMEMVAEVQKGDYQSRLDIYKQKKPFRTAKK